MPCRASTYSAWRSLTHDDQSEWEAEATRAVRDNGDTWMGLPHCSRDRLASVLLVNAGSSRALELLVKYADCCLLHLSCQHVGSACPPHLYKHG